MEIKKIKSNDIEIYDNDISLYISEYCQDNNITDLCSVSQNRYSGLLYFLYMKVFSIIDLTVDGNMYDIDKVEKVCDLYLYLCDKYDKIASIQGFSRLTGITQETLYYWGRDGSKASARASEIYKKLSKERERTLSDRLASGKCNPVGVLGCLNHWHGWSGVGNMTEDRQKQAATLTDAGSTLFELSVSGENELCDKQTQL